MDKITCLICENKFEIDKYGKGKCDNCGQEYEYEEGYRIVLSNKQKELLSKLKNADRLQFLAVCKWLMDLYEENIEHNQEGNNDGKE